MSSSDRLWVIRGLDDGCGCRLESGGGISIVDLFLLSGRGRNFYQVVEVIINNYLPIPVCPYVAWKGETALLFLASQVPSAMRRTHGPRPPHMVCTECLGLGPLLHPFLHCKTTGVQHEANHTQHS